VRLCVQETPRTRNQQRSAKIYDGCCAPHLLTPESRGLRRQRPRHAGEPDARHSLAENNRNLQGLPITDAPASPHIGRVLPACFAGFACSACLVCVHVASHSPPACQFQQETQSVPATVPPRAANRALVFSLIFTSSRCSARVSNDPLGDMQRIAQPIGRSIALRPKSAERIARVENNRRIRVNSP
jgi:hypothetical protein